MRLRCLVVWLGFFAPNALSAQPVEFAGSRSICADQILSQYEFAPMTVSADLDRDGHMDCVATGSGRTRVFLGSGNGTFSVSELTGGGRALEIVDFTRDGNLDLIAAAGSNLTHWAGDGAGAFSAPTLVSLDFGYAENEIDTADFNGDGYLDVAVNCARRRTVAVLLNDQAGGFSLVGNFNLPDSDSARMAVGDFDDDGHVDLVAARGSLRVRFGDGTGLFPRDGVKYLNATAWDILAVDLDGDGRPSLVVAIEQSSVLRIYEGDGDEGFVQVGEIDVPSIPRRLFHTDLDGDRIPDLVVHTQIAGLVVFPGDGAGGFGAPYSSFGTDVMAFGDFDEDGHVDFATSDLLVHFGDAKGGFAHNSAFDGQVAYDVDVADFNEDGHLDVVSSGGGTFYGVNVFLGDGAGSFEVPPPLIIPPGRTQDVDANDFDSDGHADFIVALFDVPDGFDGLAAYSGVGDGSFAAPVTTPLAPSSVALATADFAEDGLLDVAVVDQNGSLLRILSGDGSGSFSVVSESATNAGPRDLCVADVDGDGHVDVIVTHAGDTVRTARVYLGDGLGGMTPSLTFVRPLPVHDAAVADVNTDGIADILLSEGDTSPGTYQGGIVVILGAGAGTFGPPEFFPAACQSRGLEVADLNEDSHLDVAVGNQGSSSVSVLVGDGSGGFAEPRSFGASTQDDLRIADFDEDGHLDLLVGAGGSRDIVLYRNRTFDSDAAFPGNVNAAAGPITNVLFVNGQRGDCPDRRLEVDRNALFVLRMKAPPAVATAPFALFAWVGESRTWTVFDLPNGIGKTVLPAPPNGGRPKRIWNNTGNSTFGAPHLPSTPAPSIVLRRESGVRKRVTFTLQGIVEDPASPTGVYAVTNAITVVSR